MNQPLGNGQSQTGAAGRQGHSLIDLFESDENPVKVFMSNTYPSIFNHNMDVVIGDLDLQTDVSSFSVFDSR